MTNESSTGLYVKNRAAYSGNKEATDQQIAEWFALQAAHDKELDEMIAMGWGDTPQNRIPKDWRTRRKAEPYHAKLENRQKISDGMRKRFQLMLGNHGGKQGGKRSLALRITENEAEEIYKLRGYLSIRQIADRFGISKTAVWRICTFMKGDHLRA
jgi:hypothetical protein